MGHSVTIVILENNNVILVFLSIVFQLDILKMTCQKTGKFKNCSTMVKTLLAYVFTYIIIYKYTYAFTGLLLIMHMHRLVNATAYK